MAMSKVVKDADMKEIEFKYPFRIYSSIYISVLVVPLFTWLGVSVFLQGLVVIGAFLLLGSAFIALTFVGVLFRFSTICVEDQDISAKQFGVKWKRISWANLRQVIRITDFDLPSETNLNFYFLNDKTALQGTHVRRMLSNTKFGSLMFDERITDASVLLSIVNRHVEQNSIAIFAINRLGDAGNGRLRLVPTEHETRIERL